VGELRIESPAQPHKQNCASRVRPSRTTELRIESPAEPRGAKPRRIEATVLEGQITIRRGGGNPYDKPARPVDDDFFGAIDARRSSLAINQP
jgi:hypothetical protein